MRSENLPYLDTLEWQSFDEIEKKGWVICLSPYGHSYSFGLIFFDDRGKIGVSSGSIVGAKYAAALKISDALIQKILER